MYNSATGNFANSRFNPFRLFALSRIYYEFYRQTDYEANVPGSYNLDNVGDGANCAADLNLMFSNMMSRPYKNWAKDRLTNLEPSILYSEFGSVNAYVPNSASRGLTSSGEVSNFEGYVSAASGGSPTLS